MCKNNAIGQFDRYGREGVKQINNRNLTHLTNKILNYKYK